MLNEMDNRQVPIEEDLAFQRRIWRFERIGWYLLLTIVVLTLCGLFSRGPFSSMRKASPEGTLSVEYERFHRNGSVNTMVVRARGPRNRPLNLILGKTMMEGFSVESMQPQPAVAAASPEGIRLSLAADEHGEATLYVTWRSDGLGPFSSEVAIEGGEHLSVFQFIYP
jgi:hypothetical protein